MKTTLFLLATLLAYGTSFVQAETVNGSLTRLVGNNMDIFFHYSADGHIAQVVNHDASLLWSYDYNATMDGVPFIMQYGYTRPGEEVHSFADDEPSFERLSMLNAEGLICRDNNRNTFMWSTGENFDYEYKDGGMIRMSGSDGIVVNLSWMDGNLTAISFFENKEEVGRITCSYSTIPAKGLLPTIFSPLAFLLNYYTIQSYGPLSEGFYGCLGNYLLSGMTVSFTEEFKKKSIVPTMFFHQNTILLLRGKAGNSATRPMLMAML